MTVTASIKIDETELLYGQSTVCTALLKNGGKAPLHNLNPKTQVGAPVILLTNLETGTTTEHSVWRKEGMSPQPYDLPPGQTCEREFFLADILQFPAPGEYTLQAHYIWDDGAKELKSDSVTLKVLPAHPQRANMASVHGTLSGVYLSAWVNATDGDKDNNVLWLAHIATTGKPMVRDCTRLTDLKSPIDPYISVPPGVSPYAQWIAWVDKDHLRYLVHINEEATDEESMRLDGEGFSIIPPLFENAPPSGEAMPGADVLLYRSDSEGTAGKLYVVSLDPKAKPKTELGVVVPGPAPRWAKSAYLSNLDRHTFFATALEGKVTLKMASWSAKKPPLDLREMATWEGAFAGADAMTTEANDVFGVVLCDTGEPGEKRYVMYRWVFAAPDRFGEFDAIPVLWPLATGIDNAVLRINADGAVFGLLRNDTKGTKWYFMEPEGKVRALADPDAVIQPPVDILFRRGLEPTVMYTVPGRGFQFAKP